MINIWISKHSKGFAFNPWRSLGISCLWLRRSQRDAAPLRFFRGARAEPWRWPVGKGGQGAQGQGQNMKNKSSDDEDDEDEDDEDDDYNNDDDDCEDADYDDELGLIVPDGSFAALMPLLY